MIDKSIAILSGSLSTSHALKKQLVEYIEDFKEIELYSIDEYLPANIKCDLLIFSSQICYDEAMANSVAIDYEEKIIAFRSIDFDNLDALFKIRKNEKVYVVNDTKETTYEIIEHLRKIGMGDIEFIPHFPGTIKDDSIQYAITPGEMNLVPKGIEHVVNIGPRLFDFETMHRILQATGLLERIGESYSQNYLSKIINITKRTSRYATEVEALNEQLNLILSSIDEGILVFDKRNKIQIINRQFIEFLNLPHEDYLGRGLDTIPVKQDCLDFCLGIKREVESLFVINRTHLVFSREKMSNGNAIIFVKNIEERILETNRLNQELVKKGHVAKYNFDHIIGNSQAIREVKYISKKLAKSELTLLIYGESGTGKELFASAIHNESLRSEQAYLAINFSAFTDDLIESELFGYEDGAFTGARKGGKVGLFELANGGTILLDEIGDISPKMQTKLLRVLQEGEIIRIGGSTIHSVDVRVIAATNKDLRKMVDEGNFREDLYYRLKMGTIELPPLRKRNADINLLIDRFLDSQFYMDAQAREQLAKHQWRGNIRELKSTIEYMKAISEDRELTVREIPKDMILKKQVDIKVSFEEKVILESVRRFNDSGTPCGRQSIRLDTFDQLELTENQIRGRLQKLIEKGLLINKKGRAGTFITETGLMVIE